jgi:Outer membrane protein beta-barrel domain
MKKKNTFSIKKLVSVSFMAIALFFVSNTSFAQSDDTQVRFGVKGGLNVTNLYVDDVDDENSKIGFHAGLWMKAPLGELFAIQPELMWSSKGSTIVSYNNIPFVQDGDVRFNLNYIDLPVLGSLTLGPISLQAGPYVSYLVNANVKNLKEDLSSGAEVNLDEGDFQRMDYGLTGGLAVDIKGFQVGARYMYGLREIGNSDIAGQITRNAKNQGLQFFVGIGF